MDTLTHALSGALLARATASRPGREALPLARRMVVGMMAAAFPDTDYVAGFLGPAAYILHHRGLTHSLVMLPLWALLVSGLCSLIWRRDRGWRAYFGIAALGIGIHILGDLITSYGTMIAAPFSRWRASWDITFIIDLWFSGILVAGLLASVLWRRSRVPAAASLALVAAYVGWQGLQHQQAVEFGKAYAREAGFREPRVSAQPRPPTALNWMVVAEEGERVDYALVHLARGAAPTPLPADAGFVERLAAPYLPLDHAIWVKTLRFGAGPDAAFARAAWQHPDFEFFRWFARYPLVYRVDHGPATCVWFQDLRFFTPGRGAWPFRYGMCRQDSDGWRAYRLEEDRLRLPVN